MDIGLVKGVTPHAKDEDVIKAFKAANRKLRGSGDSVIAIKNEAGEIYRRAVINGMHQEMYLEDCLNALGLIDETAQGARKPKGVWALYGPGRDMSLDGILTEIRSVQSRKRPVSM